MMQAYIIARAKWYFTNLWGDKRPTRITLARIPPTRFVASAQELVLVDRLPTVVGLEPVLAHFWRNNLDLDLLQFGRRGYGAMRRSTPTDDHGFVTDEILFQIR